jgi:hypothetical protein
MKSALLHRASRRLRSALPVLLLLSAPGIGGVQAEELFYKYDNAEGVTVIDDHVPPQFAHKGYLVLNRAGRVVEVVPRALTESERRANGPAVQARLRTEEAERQKRYDEALLARYSSVADIEDLQRRRANEIQVRINLQKGTIAGLKEQLETEQADAAEVEMSGEDAPATIGARIEELRAAIVDEEARVVRLEHDKSTVEARYQFEIERFRTLRPGAR